MSVYKVMSLDRRPELCPYFSTVLDLAVFRARQVRLLEPDAAPAAERGLLAVPRAGPGARALRGAPGARARRLRVQDPAGPAPGHDPFFCILLCINSISKYDCL